MLYYVISEDFILENNQLWITFTNSMEIDTNIVEK